MRRRKKRQFLASLFATFWGLIVWGILAMCSVVFADEMIQGEITEVNPERQHLRIARSDPSTLAMEAESIPVQALPETRFKGVDGLEELRAGDEVVADVVKEENEDSWSAREIQLDKVNIRDMEERRFSS